MRSKREVVAEYDRFYRRRPDKWTSAGRDGFAFDTVCGYLQHQPASVLDIGCGNGHTLAFFHQRWPGARYTGLDLSPEAIKIARQRCPFAQCLVGWLGETELPKFEVVILLGVAEHLEDLQAGLAAARDLLADGGVMYVEVPNCISYETSKHVEGFREVNFGNHQHEWHLWRPTWEQQLARAGLKILVSRIGPSITTEFVWLLAKEGTE